MTQTPVLPDFVVSMDYCFYGCTALERVGNLPQQVSALSNCFRGCSNLTEVPDLPPQAENLAYCFCQCTALTAAPAISPATVNMTGCFSGCTGLTAAPVLPDSALDLTECFMDCTGLTEVPVLPRQTVSLNSCFKNCTALTGSVQIPTKAINLFDLTTLENAFSNCQNLDGIAFECCTNVDTDLLIATVGMAEAGISFDYKYDHVKSGICDGCHMANGAFPADGVTVYADNIPADILLDFVDFVCEDVPAALKKTCRRLTVTPDLSKYDAKYVDDQWRGFARNPDGTSYVECDARMVEEWLQWNPRFDMQDPLIELQSVTFHEMGHNFDTNFSPYFHHSSSARWTQLFKEEGGVFGSYDNYEPHEYLRESFARAVSFYFTYPEECLSRCPGMYAYLHALFGEEAA